MIKPFEIKIGDTEPSIAATLRQSVEGAYAPIDLTGCTVRFLMRSPHDQAIKVDQPAVIVDAVAGSVRYDWQASDTDTLGRYVAVWKITKPNGGVLTCPTEGFVQVYVLATVGGA